MKSDVPRRLTLGRVVPSPIWLPTRFGQNILCLNLFHSSADAWSLACSLFRAPAFIAVCSCLPPIEVSLESDDAIWTTMLLLHYTPFTHVVLETRVFACDPIVGPRNPLKLTPQLEEWHRLQPTTEKTEV